MAVKQILKDILKKSGTNDIDIIKSNIDKYPVISFDVFDTLLKRQVSHPTEVFSLVENAYNETAVVPISNFKELRMNAERKARSLSSTEDTTIFSIYNQLSYNDETKEALLQLELIIEEAGLSAKEEMKDVYDYARSLRKDILIISDMYLPHCFIERVLKQNGYTGYKRLYVSSETGVLKYTSNMFRFVLKEQGYPSCKILHLGDSFRSDWLMPKLSGMNAILIKTNINRS